jgi:hypothetical protein
MSGFARLSSRRGERRSFGRPDASSSAVLERRETGNIRGEIVLSAASASNATPHPRRWGEIYMHYAVYSR